MADILAAVSARLVEVLGEPSGRASVAFVGAPEISVLRFGPDEDAVTTYVTVGCSALPMSGASAEVLDEDGPRAELVLSLRSPRDEVLRALAVLACSPVVEGVVLAPGMLLDLGGPLWPGARCSSVLLDEPRGLVPDIVIPAVPQPVRLLPALPLTSAEAAAKKVHGPDWLFDRWHAQSVDLLDPDRPAVLLD